MTVTDAALRLQESELRIVDDSTRVIIAQEPARRRADQAPAPRTQRDREDSAICGELAGGEL